MRKRKEKSTHGYKIFVDKFANQWETCYMLQNRERYL